MIRKLRDRIEAVLAALEGRSGADPGDEMNRLLAGMREELIEAKAALPELEGHIADLRRRREGELREAEACVRRAGQAERIGDDETAEVARRFEAKHRARADLCEEKIRTAESELALQRRSVAEMTGQLKEALASRQALAARFRQAGRTAGLRGGGRSPTDEFDRIVREIEDAGLAAAASAEVENTLGGSGGVDEGPGPDPLDPEALAELRLRELKRRMENQKAEPDA
ncbi:MAG: hypothetical protein RRA92_01585 [Gemmatimonadota bacterium]|nr:hypothetical protein [Gemmatimonadota bacterium]